MSTFKLEVTTRDGQGTNKVKKLRAENLLPAVIYKKGKESQNVQVSESNFLKTYKLAGTTSIINLSLEGKIYPVIVKEMQRDPVKNNILHIDFLELNMDETVKLFVPVQLLNRDNIRLQPSVLTQMLEQVEVECLPDNIPNTADVDVADMAYGDSFFVKDLDIAKDPKLTMHTDLETLVCTLSEPSGMSSEEADEEGEDTVAVETEEA